VSSPRSTSSGVAEIGVFGDDRGDGPGVGAVGDQPADGISWLSWKRNAIGSPFPLTYLGCFYHRARPAALHVLGAAGDREQMPSQVRDLLRRYFEEAGE